MEKRVYTEGDAIGYYNIFKGILHRDVWSVITLEIDGPERN